MNKHLRTISEIFLFLSTVLMSAAMLELMPAVFEENVPFFNEYYIICGVICTVPFLLAVHLLRLRYEEPSVWHDLVYTKAFSALAIFYLVYYIVEYLISTLGLSINTPSTDTLFGLILLWNLVESYPIIKNLNNGEPS